MGMANIHMLPSCLKALLASRPALHSLAPPEVAAGWTGLWASRCLLGALHRCLWTGTWAMRYTGCRYCCRRRAPSVGWRPALLFSSAPLRRSAFWPRLVDRFGDILAGRGSPFRFFLMFISSLLVRVVVSHRRFFGMGCGAFLLASRPVVAGWDLQHRRRHALFHHEHFLPLSGIMSSTSFRSTSRTRST